MFMFNALEQLHWLLEEGNQNISVELANHVYTFILGEENESVNVKVMGRLPTLTLQKVRFSSLWAASSQSP